ncbi:MAG: hypothetical protein HY673_17395 [Chloroflexi bacterium]|nr:hypothetical protein [Chloroflexota bacterium]
MNNEEGVRLTLDPDSQLKSKWFDFLEKFQEKGELPPQTELGKFENLEMTIERDRGFGFRPRTAKILIPEHSGELWDLHSQVPTVLEERPNLVASLQESAGLLFLIDPEARFKQPDKSTGESDPDEIDTETAYGRPLNYIIQKLVLRDPDRYPNKKIDAYCAFCITKCDLQKYWRCRDDPAGLAEQVLGTDMMTLLWKNIDPGHLRFFATTSLGRVRGRPNITDLNKLVDPRIEPLGVVEPVMWIFDHITR